MFMLQNLINENVSNAVVLNRGAAEPLGAAESSRCAASF